MNSEFIVFYERIHSVIRTDHSVGTDTLLSSTHKALFSFIALQAPSEIVDPPLCQFISIRKSIKLPYFIYSCYSSSFTFFLASIHCLSKLFFYKEVILNPFWH